ncbi:MAG: DUF1887 family protein [Cyanobacteria bacterium SBC]|nr:DUF1887 family protein [Cyanobacteria bacterium SBC]
MNIPDKYKADRLFLLIGENTLPNYVAARTLLKEGGTVYLVFPSYEHIIYRKDLLEGVDGLKPFNVKCQPVDLGKHESNAREIYDRIQDSIREDAQEGKVGLNYTGGTKAMAVHAYRAIQELKPDAYFSYLDPRRLKMWINEGDREPISYNVPIQLSLEQLFNLHGTYWLIHHPPRTEPYLLDLAKKIAELHTDTVSEENWKKIRQALREGNHLEDSHTDFKKVLNQYVNFSGDSPQITSKARKAGLTDWKSFRDLFTGEGYWLENYTLAKVKEISKKIGIKYENSMMSFRVVDDKRKAKTKNQKASKFELDLAFIRGYQLFAISCTVSPNKDVCKNKLFEAYLRARELGGDEARVALVCCYANPEKIEQDMAKFGIRDSKIKVFGREHLANLAEEIADWVKKLDREANRK